MELVQLAGRAPHRVQQESGEGEVGAARAERSQGGVHAIQKTRATLGQPNPEAELAALEEKANASWGAYKAALDVTAELNGSLDGLKGEIEAMGKQLAEEQGNISVYTDRQTKVIFPPAPSAMCYKPLLLGNCDQGPGGG